MRTWQGGLALLACLLLAGAASAQWMECDDTVYTEIDGNSLTVHHHGALYNCCPDPFSYAVVQEDNQILVTETEILSNPCFCICCFDLSVTIEDLAPGTYDLVFTWYDYESSEWLEVVLNVVVPDMGQPWAPVVASTYLSDCYHEPTAVPDDPGNAAPPKLRTWGLIKALYR